MAKSKKSKKVKKQKKVSRAKTARQATSQGMLGASPQAADPARKTSAAAQSSVRALTISDSRPKTGPATVAASR